MALVRDYQSQLTGAAATGPKVRDYRAQVTGTASTTPKVRDYRAQVTGTGALTVLPPAGRIVGPGEVVSATAALQDGGSADSWSWTRVSGPSVTLTDAATATVTFTAPSLMPPGTSSQLTDLVLGVTATRSGVTSSQQTVTFQVLPQTSWTYSWTSTQWVGAAVAAA